MQAFPDSPRSFLPREAHGGWLARRGLPGLLHERGDAPERLSVADLLVREAGALAPGPDQAARSRQMLVRNARKQMVLDLVIEADEEPVQTPRNAQVASGLEL